MPPLTPAQRWRQVLEDPAEAARVFPSLAAAMTHPARRRGLLKLMAASFALGGLSGCGDPAESWNGWVPAVEAPPGIVPGLPNRYATALPAGGAALGVVVEHRMGRPVKVEGNPLHPASLGATDALAQAAILDFYDPDRAVGVLRGGQPATMGDLLNQLVPVRARLLETHGAGLRILTGTCASPSLGAAVDAVLARFPDARWHQWEADGRDAAQAGAVLAYGQPLAFTPRCDAADVVVGLDSDLASGAPGWVRHARDLGSRRNPVRGPMSRIYAVESVPTLLGTLADHRVAAAPAVLHQGLMALAAGVLSGAAPSDAPPWVAPALADLRVAGGRALVHAGPSLPAEAHALVHAINEALGGRGRTWDLLPPFEHRPVDGDSGLSALQDDMAAGRVTALLMLDTNPAYSVPGFAAALGLLPLSIHASAGSDETALAAGWHLPMAHAFEAWGDLRAHDGTVSVQQPQSLPLHGGQSAISLLSLLSDGAPRDAQAAVRDTWRERLRDDDAWFSALADGVVPGTRAAPSGAPLRPEAARAMPPVPAAAPLTLLFRPDPYLLDGRNANNAWLQELPRPLGKLTWDNPLYVAQDVLPGANSGDMVELSRGEVRLQLPLWRLPGLPAGCAVGVTGYGRRHVGQVGEGAGWDLFPMRAADGPAFLRPLGRHVKLATTDRGMGMVPPDEFARHGTLAGFQADPHALQGRPVEDSLYRVRPQAPVQWGMGVDLNLCIGCNACVVACQAENNVPVVGRENVLHQREMHWLRIDRYWDGAGPDAQAVFQPMLCMHCEEAPCETVCPVEATVHDSEGLNLQVYNRCVGTRFCSNNCPYKVRRFNFGPYARDEHRPEISRNPEVTARPRGVMEKCTFCVQRIAAARISRDRDGAKEETVTACQAACPTGAFSFGDLNDKTSAVAARKASPLDYALLAEQQTHPRVTYEARIRNPNPLLEG